MGYRIRLKKIIESEKEKIKPNPYQKMYDKREGVTHNMYDSWFKIVDIGIDNLGDLLYFYLELEEIEDEDLVRCRKLENKRTRTLKGMLLELLENNDIEVKRIVPLFGLDEDDLSKKLRNEWGEVNIKYLPKDKERLEFEDGLYNQPSDEDVYGYLVEIEYYQNEKRINEEYLLKEIEDLEYIIEVAKI